MITNKDKFVENKEISFILKQLETAIEKADYFSTSILVMRLKNLGYKVEQDCTDQETVVQ
jgi:hypothetical protein